MFVAVSSRTMASAKMHIDQEQVQYVDILALRRQRERERREAAIVAQKRAAEILARQRSEAREAIMAANRALSKLHQQWAIEEAEQANPRRVCGAAPYRAIKKNQLPLDVIVRRVCRATGIRSQELFSKSQKRPVVFARKAYYYWAARRTAKSFTEIGMFVDRDHTSVISGVQSYRKARALHRRNLADPRPPMISLPYYQIQGAGR